MDEVYIQWRDSLKQKQRKRTYQHFDVSLNLDNNHDFERVVNTIKNIDTHQFLPFIKFIKKDVRYRRAENRKPERSIKERPIMYASHLDAHIYSFYSYIWSKKYEKYVSQNGIDNNVIAYRKIAIEDDAGARNKNNIQFARDVFQFIQDTGDCVAIVADISKFFDNLNHKILKDQVCAVLGIQKLSQDEYKVFRSLTSYRYILKDTEKKRGEKKKSKYSKLISQIAKRVKDTRCSTAQAVYECGRTFIRANKTITGIPQGSPTSGLLANMYLSALDHEFRKQFSGVMYRRYSDDIILVCPGDIADNVFLFLRNRVRSYLLELNPSKAFFTKFQKRDDGSVICTEVTDGNGVSCRRQYLDYLGFEFDGRRILLRGRTLQRAYSKGRRKVIKYYQRQTGDNPRKPHRISKQRNSRGGQYIENAAQTMETIGSVIKSQQKRMYKFLRKRKKALISLRKQ